MLSSLLGSACKTLFRKQRVHIDRELGSAHKPLCQSRKSIFILIWVASALLVNFSFHFVICGRPHTGFKKKRQGITFCLSCCTYSVPYEAHKTQQDKTACKKIIDNQWFLSNPEMLKYSINPML